MIKNKKIGFLLFSLFVIYRLLYRVAESLLHRPQAVGCFYAHVPFHPPPATWKFDIGRHLASGNLDSKVF